MKRLLIIPLLIITGFLMRAYINIFTDQATYQHSIIASDYTVLSLNNIDKTNLQIIVGEGNQIMVHLKGSESDLAELKLGSDDIFSQFGFSDKWKNISGTITVPEGMLIEMELSEEADLIVNDIEGENVFVEKKSLVIDTTGLDSISVNQVKQNDGSEKANIVIQDWGESVVLDKTDWSILTKSEENISVSSNLLIDDNSVRENSFTENMLIEVAEEENPAPILTSPGYCGIGTNAIKNYCCQIANNNQQISCNGLGYWIFNDSLDKCIPSCDTAPASNNSPSGSQVNDSNQNQSSGSTTNNEQAEIEPEEPPIIYEDPTSQFCADQTKNKDERNQCCNDTLKNNLSTGPRPGFPDCIGEWYFNYEDGCAFECAEHTRMLEILNELKQNAQSSE